MDIHEQMKQWREGLLSDVEALTALTLTLPASPATDAVIEIVGKMNDEEREEWENRAEHFVQNADIDL